MKRNLLLAVAFVGFVVLCVILLSGADKGQKVDRLEIQRKTIDLKAHQLKGAELQEKLEVELNKDTKDQERIKQLEQENQKFQQDTQELQKQLQAKKDSKAQIAASNALNALTGTQKVSATTTASTGSKGYCGDNMYKQYIYQHESGCDTNRYNSIGCYGIGQSCPASKIAHCGSNFTCQDAWFSQYAQDRYGGWAGAYNFWIANRWW